MRSNVKSCWRIIILGLFFLSGICAAQSQDARYADGTYTGSAEGHVGPVAVQVTIQNGRIADIQIVEHDTYEFEEAIRELPGRIVNAGKVEGVEAVTGATNTSNAIFQAVTEALRLAAGEEESVSETKDKKRESIHSSEKQSLGAGTLIPTPVWVIGSYDAEGKPNVMTAAWVGICCSNPPCVMVALREATMTYGNIMRAKAFTVNLPSAALAKEAAYFGTVSGRDTNKFKNAGLTPVRSVIVNAPYVREFPLVVECDLVHTHVAGLHTLFIGEIKDVKADTSILTFDGKIDMSALAPMMYSPSDRGLYGVDTSVGTVQELVEEFRKQ